MFDVIGCDTRELDRRDRTSDTGLRRETPDRRHHTTETAAVQSVGHQRSVCLSKRLGKIVIHIVSTRICTTMRRFFSMGSNLSQNLRNRKQNSAVSTVQSRISMRIDDMDRQILGILQQDATTAKAEIAREVGLAPSAVFARIARLEEGEIVQGYHAAINPEALGFPLLAFIFIHENKPVSGEATIDALARLELAEEVHRVTGEDCYLLKIRARDTNDLRERLDRLAEIDSVSKVRTHLVLKSVPGAALPISE